MSLLSAEASADGPGSPVVIRLAGILDETSSPVLRDALAKCLTNEPDLVVLDVSTLRRATAAALAELVALADQAAAWPGSSVVLAAPSTIVVTALHHTPIGRRLPVYRTLRAALAGATDGPRPPRLRLRLDPSVSAAGVVRRLVDRACADWSVPALRDPARLVATELVSNAVRHARTRLEVTLARRGRALHVCVRDGSAAIPRPAASAGPTSEGGRGLLVVSTLASAWGVIPTADGKVVWATLPIG